MIEHLRTGSIVKVIPTDCKESYYIVRVTEVFDQHDAKGIMGVYKTYCLGKFLESTVSGYPAPDRSGAFLETTNSFEVLSY